MFSGKIYKSQLFNVASHPDIQPSSSSFTQFPLLPPEIRDSIWKLAILPSRIISLETLCTRNGSHLQTPLLSTCHEARAIALKAYSSHKRWGSFEVTFCAKDLDLSKDEMKSKYNSAVYGYLSQAPDYCREFWQWYKEFVSPILVDFDNDIFVVDAGLLLSGEGESCSKSIVNAETMAEVRHIAFVGWEAHDLLRSHDRVPRSMPLRAFWDIVSRCSGVETIILIEDSTWEWENVMLEIVEDETIERVSREYERLRRLRQDGKEVSVLQRARVVKG